MAAEAGATRVVVEEGVSFGRLLRRLRKAAELTQEELAERARLSVRGISDIERGISQAPFRATVEQLADALDLAADERAALLRAARRGPAPAASRSSVPQAPSPLLGREREIGEVLDLLGRPDVRLVTLIGPGGMGKTRLALELAAQLERSESDGVYVIPLASLRDPLLVAPTIAEAVGIRERPDQPVVESLIAALGQRRLTLVLDNFEHLLDAAALVADLLGACGGLSILATSRAPLRIQAEHQYPVPPLATPDPLYAPPVEGLRQYPAVELFVQRANAARPDFALDDGNAATVVEICHRLDGLPLAIELAAARIKVFPPQTLLQRFDRRFQVLAGGPRDLPPRLQTMRDAIAWSYDLLSPQEQSLFAQLSVFAGGCSFDAVEAVCDPEGESDLVAGLASLIDNSLLQQRGERESRFVMLETSHEYAAERLRASGDDERTRTRHACYLLELAEAADPELSSARQGTWLERLDPEIDNLRAALDWLLERDLIEEELRLAAALQPYWHIRGHWTEAIRWLEEGLARGGNTSNTVRARALGRAGGLLATRGESERATQVLEEAVSLSRRVDDRKEIAFSARYLGGLVYDRGEAAEGIRHVEESVRLSRELGDRHGMAVALGSLAELAIEDGKFTLAEAHSREAAALFDELGIRGRVAFSLNILGSALMGQDKYPEARACLEESLAVLQELEIKSVLHVALDSLGGVMCALGELDRAAALLGEALGVSQELGDRPVLLSAIGHLAELALEQGDAERAVRLAAAEADGRDVTGVRRPRVERERLERAMSRAHEALGDSAFRQAWEEGRNMRLERAVEHALGKYGMT